MKQLLLVGLLFICANSSAQENEQFAVYVSTDLGIGFCNDCWGVGIHGNIIWKESISFQLAYTSYARKAKATPADYRSSSFLDLNAIPIDQTKNIQLMAGKVFVLNESGTLRFNLTGGIGYSRVLTPTNFERDVVSGWFGYRNYTYEVETTRHPSFILNPKFEMAFSRGYGLSLGTAFIANSEGVWFSFTIGQMIGLVRKKKPSRVRKELH